MSGLVAALRRLGSGETRVDFVGRWKTWAGISGAVILVGLGSLLLRGLSFGIEFRGGSAFEVGAARKVEAGEVREALRPLGLADSVVQIVGERGVRVQTRALSEDEASAAARAIARVARVDPREVAVTTVGPTWGAQISRKALIGLVVFLAVVALYISLRFEAKMALAALLALAHDILVTAGVYSLAGFPVTPATVIAFLTILGYSLYDTVIVFDRIEEEARALTPAARRTYSEVANAAVNRVLMRSINTSLTTILPVGALLFVGAFLLGAETLRDLGLALFVGIASGTYSSVFVAAPSLALLKEREPRYRAIRARVAAAEAARVAALGPGSPGALPAGAAGVVSEAPEAGVGGGEEPGGPVSLPRAELRPPPRPGARKKKRKKGKGARR